MTVNYATNFYAAEIVGIIAMSQHIIFPRHIF